MRPCVGCLGSTRCWVCEGSGHADPERSRGRCRTCDGAGRCHLCAPVLPVQRAASDLPTTKGTAARS